MDFKLQKRLGILSIFGFSFMLAHADVLTKVTMEKTIGTEMFTMYNTGKMYFSDNQLVIDTLGNGNLVYAELSTINKLLFTTFEITGSGEINILNDGSKMEVLPSVANEAIAIKGCNGQFEYQVLNAVGSMVLQGKTTSEETINVSSLTSGIYFIRINGSILKFVKL